MGVTSELRTWQGLAFLMRKFEEACTKGRRSTDYHEPFENRVCLVM